MSGTLVFTGGGTGGHIFPGIAVAQQVRRMAPETSILWIGAAGRLEERLVPAADIALRVLPVHYLQGTRGWRRASAASALPAAVARAAAWLREVNASVVVSLGGFAAGPAAAAAVLCRVPLVLMEQNARPGLTHRWMARFAEAALTALPPEPAAFGRTPVCVVGNPVRRALLEGFQRAALPGDDLPWRVLVMGGSQGARIFNEQAPTWGRALAEAGVSVTWTHLCGAGRRPEVAERWAQVGIDATVLEFCEDMGALYRSAHVVVARAGATTVAELCALGLPAIYVPFAAAADDHQTANAMQVVAEGGALCVPEQEAQTGEMVASMRSVLASPQDLWSMGESARALGRLDADTVVASMLLARMRGESPWSRKEVGV